MELPSFEYLHLQPLFKALIVPQETRQTGKNTSVQERFEPDRPQITLNKQASSRGKWGEKRLGAAGTVFKEPRAWQPELNGS